MADLSGLLGLIEKGAEFRRLLGLLEKYAPVRASMPEAAHAAGLAALHRALSSPLLVVAPSAQGAQHLYGEISFWCGEEEATLFPEPDILPFEKVAQDSFLVQQRLQAMSRLAEAAEGRGSPPIVIASPYALISKTASPARFGSAVHELSQGMQVAPGELLLKWDGMGYRRDLVVEVPGTVTQRGGIIDVYPVDAELPARLEFFGNEVSSIRLFDPRTQRSVRLVDRVRITPAQEEMEESSTLLDYLPAGTLLVLLEPEEVSAAVSEIDRLASEMRESRLAREEGESRQGPARPYLTLPELEDRIAPFGRRLHLTRWSLDRPDTLRLPFTTITGSGGQLKQFMDELRKLLDERLAVVVVSQQEARLGELLEEDGISVGPAPSNAPPPRRTASLVHGTLAEGWLMPGRVALLTDKEIFGVSKRPRLRRPRAVQHSTLSIGLTPGDYVVHVDHGVGRFQGMIVMNVSGAEKEYLVLEYAAQDRLYVPVDQADRVSRYLGSGDDGPALTRLGTHEWDRVKKRVRESTREMAFDLLKLYASREVLQGITASGDSLWQHEMEAAFPYVETPDQLEVIKQVKEDMQSPKPMDRLVCGDVGYGKTEVGLRAAFKTVADGRQVALLVPTTVLAQQHFTTFSERLAAFPVKVEMLSRFRTDKEQKAVIEGLRDGSVDICIGTHRLLQADVAFKDLGLVIVDEEQRFGVAHKEKLKALRREVDVLTLSATPIPRTLYMSMVGVRDMSVMETPPEDRLAVKTAVTEYDDALVREAILRELERGGQVFFVHNRVHSIYTVAGHLRQLVPEARIGIGHGQMSEEHLEKAMLEFVRGETDVLVCTTIIESGLDIANANTLIVNDADKMGLAQLYQLRGRVGRGHNRAYAYFLYKRGKKLTAAAGKRLETIFEAAELGAGFRIAMADLEIRGAGNLLGAEQSGHIAAVGFDLYCQMLAQAVEEVRTGHPIDDLGLFEANGAGHASLDLPLRAYIPDHYVTEQGAKLSMYQKLAKARTGDDVEQVGRELEDRFGKMPNEVTALLYVVELKGLADRAGVEAVVREGRYLVVRMRQGSVPGRERFARFGRALRVGASQLRLDTAMVRGGWQPVLKDIVTLLGEDPAASEPVAVKETPAVTAAPAKETPASQKTVAPSYAKGRRKRRWSGRGPRPR